MLYVWVALVVKRLQDFDQPGVLALLLVPIIAWFVPLAVLFAVGFVKGTEGPNRYGDQP